MPACAGHARSGSNKGIPWIVANDTQLLVSVEASGKSVVSVADLVCNVCKASGMTSLNVLEHDMVQKELCYFSRGVEKILVIRLM